MKITKRHIAIYRAAGACREALNWAESEPRTYAMLRVAWRSWVARNASAPAKVLAELAKDADASVRSCVARNASAPANVLAELAKDKIPNVRSWVAVNASAPAKVLAELAKDADASVRYWVADALKRKGAQ